MYFDERKDEKIRTRIKEKKRRNTIQIIHSTIKILIVILSRSSDLLNSRGPSMRKLPTFDIVSLCRTRVRPYRRRRVPLYGPIPF